LKEELKLTNEELLEYIENKVIKEYKGKQLIVGLDSDKPKKA